MNTTSRAGMVAMTFAMAVGCQSPPRATETGDTEVKEKAVTAPPPKAPMGTLGGVCGLNWRDCDADELIMTKFASLPHFWTTSKCTERSDTQGTRTLSYTVPRLVNDHPDPAFDDIRIERRVQIVAEGVLRMRFKFYRNGTLVARVTRINALRRPGTNQYFEKNVTDWYGPESFADEQDTIDFERGGVETILSQAYAYLDRVSTAFFKESSCLNESDGNSGVDWTCHLGFSKDLALCRGSQILWGAAVGAVTGGIGLAAAGGAAVLTTEAAYGLGVASAGIGGVIASLFDCSSESNASSCEKKLCQCCNMSYAGGEYDCRDTEARAATFHTPVCSNAFEMCCTFHFGTVTPHGCSPG